MIAKTPEPPYYAVIFTSVRTDGDNGYAEMADKMTELAKNQPGFLGIESAREQIGISVSYWRDPESIKQWKENLEHQVARKKGKEIWYRQFTTRIAKVEREYSFES
ncbi:MAG: JEMB protein [Bacteroidetes bacterium GWF2_42_66]|nr:MAG: JEMB protein [Bacteroidetes bacterium GWA2_42_15]OFX99735.1 MAG: JEMB protein [Bacteroidetes bacterium GWE2_42_39]OFY39773.1 MAG: JEMB protein [Bacteroidetes bacterium GWF2_42_66]HBL74800.1 antibiotic biosynthesis monooxygenase [Prolixibacteraceae bacterium]HCR90553.1 antibiotic biosynthesis monooxygenase [Prolixibacteraceae bacterium]